VNLLITGGCGFIGSNLVKHVLRARPGWRVVNLDLLTYAGNLENLAAEEADPRHVFVRGDVAERATVEQVMRTHGVDAVLHLAAESHVDRSILGADPFIRTNILGTHVVLEAARDLGLGRVVVVSTDEVYGSLGPQDPPFLESHPLQPSSPYSASKASGDLLALAAFRTHGQDVVVTRCSNNYGPHQFPEKLIPLVIWNARHDRPLPVYGDGAQVRDWLHVEDHCAGLVAALERGRAGTVYNFGGSCERRNVDVVRAILAGLGKPESLIRFVADRPGHDRRYAIDATRARTELGWSPARRFEEALAETIAWYGAHGAWCERVTTGAYRDYYETQYRRRLGSPDA
jgi:dTDP-glucose 4,6-dehydratase